MILLGWLSEKTVAMVDAIRALREGIGAEVRNIEADLRGTPIWLLLVISCLALLLACTVAFGGLHP